MKLLISESQLLEVANKMFQGEFDDFVYSQEFLIGQLKSMIKERKAELDKLIQRLKREEKLIPKVRFNVEDDNGFAMVAFFNPETEKMENKNFDLGNIHWFDDEEGLHTWGKMKIFDFHGLSRFLRDPRKKDFATELSIGCQVIEVIQKTLNCQIYFKFGNHDERYQHYLWQKLGELNGVEDFELENLIKKRVPGVKFITDKRIIKANDLNIVHGHEFASSIISPVNIARGLYLRAKANTICGHHHRSSEHTEQNIEGKIVTTWSVGCLSELHPQYMPINSWNHGFCMVDLHGSKEFEVRNKRIWKGQIL